MPIPHLRPIRGHRSWTSTPAPSSRPGKNARGKRHWRPLLLRLGLITVAVCVVGGIAVFAYFSRGLPDPNQLADRSVAQSTRIYARDGKTLLYEIHGDERRTVIELNDIPEIARQATIAVEDKDFYTHGGFKLTSILRAVLSNITHGSKAQGGSTITQQLIKNTILTNEKTYTRKIKELVLAYQMERKFSKDQILKLYFNQIPYGATAYGIEAASATFFGKATKDLTLPEAAMLAALPRAPTYYSPYGNHREDLANRTKFVLDQMANEGYITKEQAEAAKTVNVVATVKTKREAILAPHFVFYVRELLSEKYSEAQIERGGLKVITTLDYDKQKIAEEAITAGVTSNEKKYRASNAALVSIDAKTGQVVAMVGSRDYFDTARDGNVNVALSQRNPGSSFKPIVYTAAFSRGYTPETVLYDLKTDFGPDGSGKPYIPLDYDGKERGPLSMRQTLAGSLNIPAVKTLYLAGIPQVVELANSLGYTTLKKPDEYGLALALGGAGVRLLDHAAAFGVLARDGVRLPTSAILRVEDQRGKVLEEWKPARPEQVIDKNVARVTNSILTDNAARSYVFGARSPLILSDRLVAAKTGTTNDWRDGWTMGFTPSLVTGVWAGNNDNSAMAKGADGVFVAAPIWNTYMKNALQGTKAESFAKPKPNNSKKPVFKGDTTGDQVVPIDTITKKRIPASCLDQWPADFRTTTTVREIHSILYYIAVSDPLGDAPKDPASDPMFVRWEKPIQAWAAKKFDTPSLAEELCDLRTESALPTISMASPTTNQTISSGSLVPIITVAGKKPIQRVEYLIDGVVVGTASLAPFAAPLDVSTLSPGLHTLTARVVDTIENSATASVDFNVAANGSASLYFASPAPGSSFTAGAGVSFSLHAEDATGVQQVTLFEQASGGLTALQTVTSPSATTITFVVPNLSQGTHTFIGRLQGVSGGVLTTDGLIITIEP